MSSDNTNWLQLYEAECRLMGMDGVPAQRDPAADGLDPEYAKFPYAVITPDSLATPDEDCFVLLLLAEGFRSQDMDKWHYHAQHFTRIVLSYAPFNEFTKNIKIIRVDVVSNEEGIAGDVSPDGRFPKKDTYFHGHAWANNQQRLGRGDDELRLATGNAYCPKNTDSSKIVIFNTSTYSASGAGYANLSWANVDVSIHETSHNIAWSPDEYLYSGTGQLDDAKADYRRNLQVAYRDYFFNKNFQDYNPWVRLLGKNGTRLHPWYEGVTTTPEYLNLFRPTDRCKMRFVGANLVYDRTQKEEFGFCELCKEMWRNTLCLLSHNPQLQFQPYNDMFYDNEPVLLNDRNFVIRLPENPETVRVRVCKKVFGEALTDNEADNMGLAGRLTMTVRPCTGDVYLCMENSCTSKRPLCTKDPSPRPLYENVPVDTPLALPAGSYRVEAVFTGTWNGRPITLTLPAQGENTFTVRRRTPVWSIGSYEDLTVFPYLPEGNDAPEVHNYGELWQDRYNADILGKSYDGDPVQMPVINLREDADPSALSITCSWHVQNFDGTPGTALSRPFSYPEDLLPGPSSVGSYVLHVEVRADKTAGPYAGQTYLLDYPFTIETPFHAADFYPVDGANFSHELVANDYRIVTITGEGFTEADQPVFEAEAKRFIKNFISTFPVNNVAERFSFYIENTMSAASGITRGDEKKDTFYGFRIERDPSPAAQDDSILPGGSIGTYRTNRDPSPAAQDDSVLPGGSIGTYRTDMDMDTIIFTEAWRRDTNRKTNAQWGATLVILNDRETDAIYNYRHPEGNRAVVLSTVGDGSYKKAIEALTTQFAFMRSDKTPDLLDRVHWMEGPGRSMDPEEIRDRLIESCYSHEVAMHRPGDNNLPRPVVASRLADMSLSANDPDLQARIESSFNAYSYGHELVKNTGENDTFTFRYYKDADCSVGEPLPGLPSEPGSYWVEAIYPRGEKYYAKTETDRYGYTYKAGDPLPGINGRIEWEFDRWVGHEAWTQGCNERGVGESTAVRGFVRFTLT